MKMDRYEQGVFPWHEWTCLFQEDVRISMYYVCMYVCVYVFCMITAIMANNTNASETGYDTTHEYRLLMRLPYRRQQLIEAILVQPTVELERRYNMMKNYCFFYRHLATWS